MKATTKSSIATVMILSGILIGSLTGCGTSATLQDVSVEQVRQVYTSAIMSLINPPRKPTRSSGRMFDFSMDFGPSVHVEHGPEWSGSTCRSRWVHSTGLLGDKTLCREDATVRKNKDGTVSLTIYHIRQDHNFDMIEGNLISLFASAIWYACPDAERGRLLTVKALLSKMKGKAVQQR